MQASLLGPTSSNTGDATMFRHSILGAALILAGSAAAGSAKSDTTFLTDAIQTNLAEISVGDLAQKNGGQR